MLPPQSTAHANQQAPHADEREDQKTAPPPVEAPEQDAPYIKVFGADVGVFEFVLAQETVTIGRSAECDIRLPDRSVSRQHAVIRQRKDKYVLTDSNSTGGTIVNGKNVESSILSHGDSMQIAAYVLQFRTHRALPGAEMAAAKAKTLLRAEYCTLPSTMRLKYRVWEFENLTIFQSGDTLRVGKGGLLVPSDKAPGEGACLELELTVSHDISRQLFGEIMGVMEEGGTHWMCVKLHSVPRGKREDLSAKGSPGDWIEVVPT